MKRIPLKLKDGVRTTFYGVFDRFGMKKGYNGPEQTVLLKDIRDESDNLMADHLWFNLTKGFKQAELEPGDRVRFRARVKKYEKGYKGPKEDVYKPIEKDYKLSHPTKVTNLREERDMYEE